jgi:hemerythrin
MMKWKAKYALGIEEIDKQHRVLLDCMTTIEDAIQAGDRWSAVHFGIVQLRDYARVHFTVEETVFKMHQYPGTDEHIRQHQVFMGHLHDIEQKTLAADDLKQDLLKFLRDWLVQHILSADRDYARHIGQQCPVLIRSPAEA